MTCVSLKFAPLRHVNRITESQPPGLLTDATVFFADTRASTACSSTSLPPIALLVVRESQSSHTFRLHSHLSSTHPAPRIMPGNTPTPPPQAVQPLHPILDSKENVTKARVQDLVQQQKLKYVSPSDRNENMSPTSKKLMNHKMRHLYDNPVKKLSGLRLEAANSSLPTTASNESTAPSVTYAESSKSE